MKTTLAALFGVLVGVAAGYTSASFAQAKPDQVIGERICYALVKSRILRNCAW